MNDNDISIIIDSFEELDELSEHHFEFLKNNSTHEDSFVRSRCAALLVNFKDDNSKQLLFKLADDEDFLVRTEALDSLSIFSNNTEVSKFLYQAIKKEQNDLARFYAILSCADTSMSLNNSSELLSELKNLKSLEKSPNCVLSYCYALYILGDKNILNEFLSFLRNDNYQIRCAAISLLSDIIDENNTTTIKNSISELLETEDTIAVKSSAERFLKNN